MQRAGSASCDAYLRKMAWLAALIQEWEAGIPVDPFDSQAGRDPDLLRLVQQFRPSRQTPHLPAQHRLGGEKYSRNVFS